MTDIVDSANNVVQNSLDNTIHNARCAHQANDVLDCEDCGGDIGATRKQAVPWATRCIDCQEYYERKTGR